MKEMEEKGRKRKGREGKEREGNGREEGALTRERRKGEG